ncbi:MAG: DNA/RNA non-specific endonuclease [Bacteroidales bacterium]|nr:DNA/RNA non-specific endonuclease [Bacteroidales bacterium]
MAPAVDQDWLELPSGKSGSQYECHTLYVDGERNYTYLYDKNNYHPLWAAYPLSAKHMGNLSRPSNWSYNDQFAEGSQPDLCSGSYSGNYSRGHVIPNASRNGIKAMQLQTFYVTNSVPQIQDHFNGGIWQELEAALQGEAKSQTIYIVTGSVLNKVGESKSVSYTTPGKNSSQRCAVPNYFYKVALKVRMSGSTVISAQTIGFWFEHRTYSDSYTNYAVSVDEIEKYTGFDFFVNLPDNIETAVERNSSWSSFDSF